MEIDWERVRRVVVLNKPTKLTIGKLVHRLPTVKILGYGFYGFNNLWYLLIEDVAFPPDYGTGIITIPLEHIVNRPQPA